MAKVKLRDGETLDDLIARFKTEVKRADILAECRKREYFVNKSLKRKMKSKAAALRRK